jgi:hypothetical protein
MGDRSQNARCRFCWNRLYRSGQVDFAAVRHSVTDIVLPGNDLFNFQGNIIKVSRIRGSMWNIFAPIYLLFKERLIIWSRVSETRVKERKTLANWLQCSVNATADLASKIIVATSTWPSPSKDISFRRVFTSPCSKENEGDIHKVLWAGQSERSGRSREFTGGPSCSFQIRMCVPCKNAKAVNWECNMEWRAGALAHASVQLASVGLR